MNRIVHQVSSAIFVGLFLAPSVAAAAPVACQHPIVAWTPYPTGPLVWGSWVQVVTQKFGADWM